MVVTDDFTQLNEKFIKARRDYEALLESSMAQPPQPNWGRPGPSQPSYAYPSSGGPSQGYPQDPQRFYSPRPQDQDPSAPPRNGPAPFYVVGQQQPPYPPTSGPQVDPRGRTPSGSRPSDPYTQHQRPKSTYETPQELSAYASPIDTRPKSQSPELRHSYLPQAQQAPPPQAQKPAQVPEQTPEQAPGQQPLAQAEPPQPSHQPPSVPSPGPLGLTQHSAYPVLGTQGAGGYQAYSRPQYAPPRAQATQGDGSDFYR
ncbi:MAG: ESCRT-0 subunit protein hse1 [Cirrosporium novae-zelandiae]|nr:MAG: ESCRT-0 subunit protein hse1 [Cirrosporium novae-zelandiae]